MNPLTQIRNTQKISKQEIAAGYSDAQSWHARFKHSAYIYSGGLPYGLTEGDLLAVFSQYGEVIDVNLVRNKDNGKSRGFAFLAYEDQRSTNLAVDNLNGTKVGGRIVTVDHVDNYKRKIAEVEGREVSDSEEEEPRDVSAEDAEAQAIASAVQDGAQIVTTAQAGRDPADGGAGPRSTDGGGPDDAPWASKTSVYALLNSELPKPPTQKRAAEEELDPLLMMKSSKKLKKDKKEKKKKKEKKDRLSETPPKDAVLPPTERFEAERRAQYGHERPTHAEERSQRDRHDGRRSSRRAEDSRRDRDDRRVEEARRREDDRRRDDSRRRGDERRDSDYTRDRDRRRH